MAKGLYASWTHGCASVCESPNVSTRYLGFGAEFTLPNNANVWIHVPVPTPVLIPAGRATLDKVIVCYRAPADQVQLNDVHVFDGVNRIKDGHMEPTGDFLNRIVVGGPGDFSPGNAVTFNPRPSIGFGVGISLNVRSSRPGAVFFVASAGADFVV